MSCFQPLNVSEFQQMKNETLSYINNHPEIIRDNPSSEYFVHVPLDQFPAIESFLKARVKTKINETSICFVPPNFTSTMHIDGIRKDKDNFYRDKVKARILEKQVDNITSHDIDKFPVANQYVLIIPIANYENTISSWYTNDLDDNDEIVYQHTREQYPYQFYISFTKDYVVKEPIETTILKSPTFIKSDIYHNVSNNSNDTRIAVVVRFMEYDHYSSVNDIFDCEGLI